MSTWVDAHYGVIVAIGVKVYAADSFRGEIPEAVWGDKLSAPGVIVTGYEIVKLALFVVVISAVTSFRLYYYRRQSSICKKRKGGRAL